MTMMRKEERAKRSFASVHWHSCKHKPRRCTARCITLPEQLREALAVQKEELEAAVARAERRVHDAMAKDAAIKKAAEDVQTELDDEWSKLKARSSPTYITGGMVAAEGRGNLGPKVFKNGYLTAEQGYQLK